MSKAFCSCGELGLLLVLTWVNGIWVLDSLGKYDFLFLQQRKKEAMREISAGQRVICKHKNGRYYQCDVVQLTKETFYEVNFDDGSFSENLFPEDIVVRGLECGLHCITF